MSVGSFQTEGMERSLSHEPAKGHGGKVAIITGISGQDGSYLAELLLSKGYQVWPPPPSEVS